MRLIDADAFFEKFRAGGDLYSELLESEDMREILKDEEITPTVDAEPVVHAKWEYMQYTGGAYTERWNQCSNCGNEVRISYSQVLSDYKYCPHCGAKMDLED